MPADVTGKAVVMPSGEVIPGNRRARPNLGKGSAATKSMVAIAAIKV